MTDALFDHPAPPPVEPPKPKLSTDRKRTIRQREALDKGLHPLAVGLQSHIPLHPDAAPADDRAADGLRCGTCQWRMAGRYAKCLFGAPARVSNGPATDVRAWWPACRDYAEGQHVIEIPFENGALDPRARQEEGKPPAGPGPALVITVLGQPAPQGSKHARPIYTGRGENRKFTGKVAQVESSKDKVKSWREAVKTAAFEARQARGFTDRFLPDGPVGVEVTYCFDKPASAPKTRRTWPVKRSTFDVDKLLRSTFDALTDAGTLKDDSQVIDVRARKVYTDDPAAPLAVPGAVIRVWAMS